MHSSASLAETLEHFCVDEALTASLVFPLGLMIAVVSMLQNTQGAKHEKLDDGIFDTTKEDVFQGFERLKEEFAGNLRVTRRDLTSCVECFTGKDHTS